MSGQVLETRRASESVVSQSQCRICGKIFLRSYHLTRHLKTHVESESHTCEYCGKVFKRSDVLRRHMRCHSASEGSVHRDKGFRACYSCVTAKTKCTGSKPCHRCKTRGLECKVYPLRSDLSTAVDGNDTSSTSQDRSDCSFSPEVSHNDVGELSTTPTAFNDPQNIVSISDNASTSTFTRAPPLEQQASQISDVMQQAGVYPYTRVNYDASQVSRDSLQETQLANFMFEDRMIASENIVQNPAFNNSTGFDNLGSNGSFDLMAMNWLPSNLGSDTMMNVFDDLSFVMPSMGQNISSFPDMAPSQQIGMHGEPNLGAATINPSQGIEHHNFESGDIDVAISPALGSHSTSSGRHVKEGQLYVDGSGSRAVNRSHKRRRKREVQDEAEEASTTDAQTISASTMGFPDSLSLPQQTTKSSNGSLLQMATYTELRNNFEMLCTNPSPFFSPFPSGFLSFDDLDFFVKEYLASFQPTLPFINRRVLLRPQQNWILVLAIAAVGCSVTDAPSKAKCLATFQEFLRRAVLSEIATNQLNDPLGLAQAALLSCIGLSQCSDASSSGEKREKITSWLNLCLGVSRDYAQHHHNGIQFTDVEDWSTWISAESQRRLAYGCWLFTRILNYQFDLSIITDFQLGNYTLPFHEAMWEAEDEKSWEAEKQKLGVPPTYEKAVKELYLRKSVTESLGNLGQTVLVHAVLGRTSDMARFLQDPLSTWIPTKSIFSEASLEVNDWLPGNPLYSRWRNSACDCLDVLHWHANSLTAKANGFEPSAILHLHLARLVLLTPFREIRQFCERLASHDLPRTSFVDHISRPPRKIWQWLVQDQYKARLALIHAGAAIWHIRGWSQKSFMECFTMYLASLIIWTYSSYAAEASSRLERSMGDGNDRTGGHPSEIETLRSLMPNHSSTSPDARVEQFPSPHDQPYSNHSEADDSDNSSSCDSISSIVEVFYIDRPCDDHLVQTFVKGNRKMTANMTRVGPVCDRAAPVRILRQGAKVLTERCWMWPIGQQYRQTLMSLGERLHRSLTTEGEQGTRTTS